MTVFQRNEGAVQSTVPYLSVAGLRDLVGTVGLPTMLCALADRMSTAFTHWDAYAKSPRVTHETASGFVELMPVADAQTFAFKYVNCHPGNTALGVPTVAGFGAMMDLETGRPIFLSEMTVLTAMRTAATSLMAARALARQDARTLAIIGNGAQCEFQALAFQHGLGIDALRLYDIDPAATAKVQRNLAWTGLDITACTSAAEAAEGADIVTTCTADLRNARVLTDAMVVPGMHLNALGGDCAGKTELDPAILHRAEIFVEFPPQTRVEGEIQQLAPDHPVTELCDVLRGAHQGRGSAEDITLFDSVGFAVEDLIALSYCRDMAMETGLCGDLDLLVSPNDCRDLFGVLAS